MRKGPTKLDPVAERSAPGNEREGYRGDGDSKKPQRQLHESKGNVKPTHRPILFGKPGGELTVDKDIHLHCAGCNHSWPHQPEHRAAPLITPMKIGPEAKPDPPQ